MISPSTVCPGCSKTKSRNARLCRSCRREATAAGVAAVLVSNANTITPGQMRAFYGKLGTLVTITDGDRRELKAGLLAEVSERFGRTIEHTDELREKEASWILERLQDRLDLAGPTPNGPFGI